MPDQICYGRGRTSRGQSVKDSERRLKSHDQDRSILVTANLSDHAGFKAADTHPTAYVWQSHAGAIAVIGSLIVRADMCSEFCGWNRMMLPSVFPAACTSVPEIIHMKLSCVTKGDISVSHPRCSTNCMVRSKSCDLLPCKQIPHNCNFSSIVTDEQPSSPSFTNIIRAKKHYRLFMTVLSPIEAPFNGQ